VVAWIAAVVFLVGLLLMWTSREGMNSPAVWIMDQVVELKSAYALAKSDKILAHVVTTYDACGILFSVSCGVLVAGAIGAIGAYRRLKACICVYVLLAGFLAVAVFFGGVHIAQRKFAVEPLAAKTVKNMCRPSVYMSLSSELECDWALKQFATQQSELHCGQTCRQMVDHLLMMGHMDVDGRRVLKGCQLMRQLCARFEYEAFDTQDPATCAKMLRRNKTGSSFGIPWITEHSCLRQCDNDIKCQSYAYSQRSTAEPELCILGAGVPSNHPPPNWTRMSLMEATSNLERGGSIGCSHRTVPVVIQDYYTQTFFLATISLFLSCTLFLSTCGSMCLLYNMSFKRRGKATAMELCLMMCCPCCVRQHSPFSDDEYTSNDDDDEGSDAENVE
jgi:hypothetical protein